MARGLPDARALLRELQAFKVRFVGKAGHASFGGVGAHDDLVVAVVLAVWWRTVGQSADR